MARRPFSFNELVAIARRTGVERYVDPQGRRGRVIAAPSSHRGKKGSMGTNVGLTRHHTGTDEGYKPTEDYPTYQVVKEGRPGLENSLSAYGLGRFYGIYVFSEFLSWHAGTWNWLGITDGNGHLLGIEAEGTGRIWTPFQREFYPRLSASILLAVGEDVDMMPRHADGAMPRGRKDDAKNLWPNFTGQVQGYINNPATLAYGGSPITPPKSELEDDDEMMLITVGTATYVQFGSVISPLQGATNKRNLQLAGVKTVELDRAQVTRMQEASAAQGQNEVEVEEPTA